MDQLLWVNSFINEADFSDAGGRLRAPGLFLPAEIT